MSATFFLVEAWGASPEMAFDKARQEYGYRFGYDGDTGTIVEKDSFIIFPLPEGEDPEKYAEKIATEDPRITKYGPAGCFVLKESQVKKIKIIKREVGVEKYDYMARAITMYSVRGCSTGACYSMCHTLKEAEEDANRYAAEYLEKIEIRKEVVAPSDTLFIYEPENKDECAGHYLFFGYAPY